MDTWCQDVLEATVAAYIFFLISIQLPAVREKRLVGPAVAMLTQQIADIAGAGFLYQVNFELHPGVDWAAIPQPVTPDVIKSLFARIAPNEVPQRVPTQGFGLRPSGSS